MSQRVRIGAVCRDGTISSATGRGAGSWHGGVDRWIYADSTPSTSYSSYSGSSYSGSSYSGSSYSGSSYSGSSRRSSSSWSFSGLCSFLKKCFKFILDILYWVIIIPLGLVVGLCWCIFQLFKFFYKHLKQTKSVQAWIKEFRKQDPNIWQGVIVFYYLVYHVVGVPVYWLGLVLMIMLRIFYKGCEKFYKMVRKLAELDVHKAEGEGVKGRQNTGQQDVNEMQNPQQQAQLRQLKQKLTSLMEQIATTKQSNQSQSNTTQQLLQHQSTKITQLTEQIQQQPIKPSQTNQKTTQLYQQKFKQYDERLAKISAQITELKVEHQVEVERVKREKDAVIEGLEGRIKELGEGRSEVIDRTLGEGDIVGEDCGNQQGAGEEQDQIVDQEEMVRRKVNYLSPGQNKQSGFCYGALLKVILLLLGVNVARIFCKVIQTEFI